MNSKIVDKILSEQELISQMLSEVAARIILENLKVVLDNNIEGDIVELGCNMGTSALFIQRMLRHYNSSRQFHVYDSFKGLPQKTVEDLAINATENFQEGSAKIGKEVFIWNFQKRKLELPIIHVGWFGEIPDNEYPGKIAFAFFDGDFYSSIMDSFNKVYPRLRPGARVIIHDYRWSELPGVEKACQNFLKDKPENGKIVNKNLLGILIKE